MRTTQPKKTTEISAGNKALKTTEGKKQPHLGKRVTNIDIKDFGRTDPKVVAEEQQAKYEAQHHVRISPDVPQFNQASVHVSDPNAAMQMQLNSKTYPGQHFRKEPKKIVQGIDAPAMTDPYHSSTQGY